MSFLPLLRPCIMREATSLRREGGRGVFACLHACVHAAAACWGSKQRCYCCCCCCCWPGWWQARFHASCMRRAPPLHDGALRLAEALLLVPAGCVGHEHGELGLHRLRKQGGGPHGGVSGRRRLRALRTHHLPSPRPLHPPRSPPD